MNATDPDDQRVLVMGQCSDGQFGSLAGECAVRPTTWYINVTHFRDEVVQVCLGEKHSLALTKSGLVYSCGSNDHGQLGRKSYTSVDMCDFRPGVRIVQMAAGQSHNTAVSSDGRLYAWGLNDNCQCGMNEPVEMYVPTRVQEMSEVCAGGDHFAVLTRSGSVLCWGRNEYGQVGMDGPNEVKEPTVVQGGVQSMRIIQVACGGRHTCVLTAEGRIFCFGANNLGQLGSGRKSGPLRGPSPILDLFGSRVKAVACGSAHTIVLTPQGPYTFGYNEYGQLGTGKRDQNAYTPVPLPLKDVHAMFAGWDQTVVLCGGAEEPWLQRLGLPRVLSYGEAKRAFSEGDKIDVAAFLEFVFNSMGCLNGSFLNDADTYPCNVTHHGLRMDDVMKTFNMIGESQHAREFAETVIGALNQVNFKAVYNQLLVAPQDHFIFEVLRFFLILPWFHGMISPSDEMNRNVIVQYIELLEKATKHYGHVLRMWWLTLEPRHFNRVVSCLHNYVAHLFGRNPNPNTNYLPALNVLDMLCQPPAVFRWSQYPFLMNAEAKTSVLEADSMLKMHMSVANTMPYIFNPSPENAFLNYGVRRQHIVEDTYEQIMRTAPHELAKPLRVTFLGEEAEDMGGVRKEYFMLLFQELLQPTYGMFVEDPDSHMVWFSGVDGDEVSYELVGRLCALAIYNFTIVNLPFPLALYKKELHPVEGRSLEQVSEYDEPDLEEVFALTFTATLSVFGHSEDVPLVPNGQDLLVSQKNKQDFIQRYVEMKMEKGLNGVIARHLQSFIRGFTNVLNRDILALFQPRELQEMVVGNENYDWQEFKQNTVYKDEYHANHPVVEAFWEVFFELSPEQKKAFLRFLMGTDRVPLRGMKEVKMTIQPEPDDLIPVAHTCFNLLDLPRVTDRAAMRKRILIALDHTHGFSLA